MSYSRVNYFPRATLPDPLRNLRTLWKMAAANKMIAAPVVIQVAAGLITDNLSEI